MFFKTSVLGTHASPFSSITKTLIFSAAFALIVAPFASGCGQDATVRQTATGDASGGAGGTGGSGSAGSGGTAGGMPKDPLPLTILNWNVHNYLNDKDDSDAFAETIVSTAVYTGQRKAIGVVLNAMDPDIAVLQEVENEASLTDLNQTELGGKYTAQGLIDGNDPRGIDIAVLSKMPIEKIVTHKDDSFTLYGTVGPSYTFSRDCPEIHITYNGRKLILLGTHLKAKANDNPTKRLAEAQHTRAIADNLVKANPGAAILVLGDFNDTEGSPPYLAVMGEDPNRFTNAPELLPAQDRWSYTYSGKQELVDHQMSNPLLAPMLDPTSVKIRHSADVQAASDHSPVMATYLVN